MYIITEDHTILNQQNLRYYIKNELTNNMVTFQTWPKIAILSAVEFENIYKGGERHIIVRR
jgi:hypothetical protein